MAKHPTIPDINIARRDVLKDSAIRRILLLFSVCNVQAPREKSWLDCDLSRFCATSVMIAFRQCPRLFVNAKIHAELINSAAAEFAGLLSLVSFTAPVVTKCS